MKRSEINEAIRRSIKTLEQNHICLPFFAYWTMAQWKQHSEELNNIKSAGLGWDVTDFGSGNFEHCGSVLFTLRNGSPDGKAGTPYAEKLILQRHQSEQEIPFHFHKIKMNFVEIKLNVYHYDTSSFLAKWLFRLP